MTTYFLEVDTSVFTDALKKLCRIEKSVRQVLLKFQGGQLSIHAGPTQYDLPARGSWGKPVSVDRAWAEALVRNPPDAAVTTLKIVGGKLDTRDFLVPCSIQERTEEDEELIARRRNITGARQALSAYQVTEHEIDQLIDAGDRAKAAMWAPGEERMIEQVANAWKQLASYGVECSEIRALLNQKLRSLWRNRPTQR
jgi:hypothetical protein